MKPLDHCHVAQEELEAIARWADKGQTAVDLIDGWAAVKELIGVARDVAADLEAKACAQITADDRVDAAGKVWTRSVRRSESWTPEEKDELRRKVVAVIAKKVATDEVTGEFNDEHSKVVQAALREFDRFQTTDPAKFKTSGLKPEGIHKSDFVEKVETFPVLREVRS